MKGRARRSEHPNAGEPQCRLKQPPAGCLFPLFLSARVPFPLALNLTAKHGLATKQVATASGKSRRTESHARSLTCRENTPIDGVISITTINQKGRPPKRAATVPLLEFPKCGYCHSGVAEVLRKLAIAARSARIERWRKPSCGKLRGNTSRGFLFDR
jgi:hypothetical protein